MIAFLLLLASTSYVPIEVGRFDPSAFPNAQKVERRMPHADLNNRVERILAKRECRLEGQNKTKYDIVVPYAILMDPLGEPKKVVVKDIGCAPIERLVGEIASELGKAGDFKVPRKDDDRWYVSEAYFTRLSEDAARGIEDQDKVICHKETPVPGSRIAMKRVCLTVAEWKVYEVNRQQFRRDMEHRVPTTR